MSNIVEVEYKVVQERTLPVIASEIIQIEENACRVALDSAIRIGEKLCEAKEIAGHGDWAKWCEENLNYSQRKAERFMKIYSEYGDENSLYLKSTTLSNLSISKALSLLDLPKEDVEKFAEKHDVGELSTRQLEEEIRKLKEEKTKSEEAAKEASACIENLETEIKDLKEDKLKIEDAQKAASDYVEKLEVEVESLKKAGADSEEVKKIQAKLEKEKEKTKELKDRLNAEKEDRQKAVDKALLDEKEKITEEARKQSAEELQAVKDENEKLEKEIERLSKRAENSSNENLLIFKLRANQIQEAHEQCTLCIEKEADPERKEKMKNALDAVIDSLKGGV